jgi:hypothetical protein
MASKDTLLSWVKEFTKEIAGEWDWPVTITVDKPEKHQASFQVFFTLKKLSLTVVLLLDVTCVETKNLSHIKGKVEVTLSRLKELAEQRIME